MTDVTISHPNPDRQDLADLLEKVLTGTAAVFGDAYYRALVMTLATAFRVRYAVIGRLTADNRQVRTLAVCADGQFVDNITYPLVGTPCERVIGWEPRYFPEGVAELFPDDELLRQLGIACYLGVPLYAADGAPLGNLLIMDSSPLAEAEVGLAIQLMKLFALRTAGEIERQEREQRLQMQELQFGVFSTITKDGMLICDEQATIVAVNPAYCSMIGYSEQELLGRSICDIEANESAEEVKRHTRTLIEQGFDRFVSRHRRKDGTILDLEVSVSHAPEAGLFISLARDITEQIRNARLLAESEQRFRLLVEQVPSLAVQGYDRERRVIFWNQASERLYGYRREEALGQPLEELIIPPEMREAVVEGVQAWVEDGVPIPAGELQLMRKDGTQVPVFSSHVMQLNGRGEHEMYCIDLDMTELKQAQQAADAANRAKSEFLANMSHEVRTPLNGIMGMAQLLRMTGLTEEQQRFVGMLDESSQTLLSLINDILDISRIEAGRLTIEELPFNLSGLLEQTLQLHRATVRQKGLRLDYSIDPSLPSCLLGDPLRIKQVLLNLVGHAVKFTSRGGVELEVTRSGGHGSECLLFTVRDSGIGISAEALDRIFDQFTQADGSTSRFYGGSGLGLTICRRLSELMGGSIRAESSLGQGSSFYLELPLQVTEEPAVPPVAAAQAAPAAALPPLRILLVEDQEVGRKFATAILERTGHQVVSASDGLTALQLLPGERFDLVLLDIQMPGMGGEEVLQQLRQIDDCRALPVIALTAHALAGDRERLLQNGFDGYCAKPLEVSALHAEITRVLVQPAPFVGRSD